MGHRNRTMPPGQKLEGKKKFLFHWEQREPHPKKIRPSLGGALLGSLFFMAKCLKNDSWKTTVRTRCLFQGLDFFLGQYNYDD